MDFKFLLTTICVIALIVLVPLAVVWTGYYAYYGELADADLSKRVLSGWGAVVTILILLTSYDGI